MAALGGEAILRQVKDMRNTICFSLLPSSSPGLNPGMIKRIEPQRETLDALIQAFAAAGGARYNVPHIPAIVHHYGGTTSKIAYSRPFPGGPVSVLDFSSSDSKSAKFLDWGRDLVAAGGFRSRGMDDKTATQTSGEPTTPVALFFLAAGTMNKTAPSRGVYKCRFSHETLAMLDREKLLSPTRAAAGQPEFRWDVAGDVSKTHRMSRTPPGGLRIAGAIFLRRVEVRVFKKVSGSVNTEQLVFFGGPDRGVVGGAVAVTGAREGAIAFVVDNGNGGCWGRQGSGECTVTAYPPDLGMAAWYNSPPVVHMFNYICEKAALQKSAPWKARAGGVARRFIFSPCCILL